jgi:predicted LPLAT superfamily acyltransferase
MGNWEVAARLLQQNLTGLRLLLYMGARASQKIEGLQKETVAESGIGIIGVDETGGSPLDIIDGVRFLRTGGIVSMAGDVLWRDDQAAVEVPFLGKTVRLPEAPFTLAMASGAPLVVFFALRTEKGRYHFQAANPIFIDKTDRSNRNAAIQAAARRYAALLEDAVRANPSQWYHFEPFL